MWITCAQPSLHSRLSPVPPPPELPPRRLDGPRGHGRGARAGTSDRGGARARQRPRQRNARARGAPRSDTETDTWHTNAYNTYWCMLYTFCISIYIHIYMLYNTFFKKNVGNQWNPTKKVKNAWGSHGLFEFLENPAVLLRAGAARSSARGALGSDGSDSSMSCGTEMWNSTQKPQKHSIKTSINSINSINSIPTTLVETLVHHSSRHCLFWLSWRMNRDFMDERVWKSLASKVWLILSNPWHV